MDAFFSVAVIFFAMDASSQKDKACETEDKRTTVRVTDDDIVWKLKSYSTRSLNLAIVQSILLNPLCHFCFFQLHN